MFQVRDGRLNGPAGFSGGLRGIPAPASPLDLRAQAEGQLHALLLAEHPTVKKANPRALGSFLVGCHHRIAHAALVDWLVRNQKFQREG